MMASGLTGEELAFVSGVMSRTGFWISYCEDTDHAEKSEDEEKLRMTRALRRIEKSAGPSAVARAAALALSNMTPDTNETQESLTEDIRRAVKMFKAHEDKPALNQFRKALMYIGTSVARAYREELDHHEDEFLLETFMNRLSGFLNRESDPEEYKDQNISPAEDSALTAISEALRTA